ncbi:helix-turn-helix domain-containing protein [Streptomyces albofaciens JCM 4342]|uniref:helix-turn-helix domain-containing protein n=1 Tax=Streptomyces albofaciens TaxID=66866 RepID=UPI001239AF6D|nr:helix-turn-helix domain-containing protein [Streptomyces albofaciens]KAA6223184.1 helix-turn-helix domain-containing protein [Streptomyces albofaciens JCM 4342]
MNRNGHTAEDGSPDNIVAVPYRPTPGSPPGAEVLDFPRLAARARSHGLDPYRPRRPAFHELLTVTTGTLRCSVDFNTVDLTPGSWLWVRPGQVLQFLTHLSETGGTAILFPPGFLSTPTAAITGAQDHTRCRLLRPTARQTPALGHIRRALEESYRDITALPLKAHIEAMRSLLSALLLHLAHPDGSPSPGSPGDEPFHRFRQAVEESFCHTHRVEEYAARLGYSVRTLTRATRAAAGCGAKRFIDDRILLEAKRLLAHTALPPAVIGERIGFHHATAFSAFFRRRTGTTPTAFRTWAAGAPSAARHPAGTQVTPGDPSEDLS